MFTGLLEVAMEMVDTVVQEGQIVGVYDAPVRARAQNETKLSPVSTSITEQIKQVKGGVDAICVSVRMKESAEEEEDENETNAESKVPDQSVEIEAFAVGGFGAGHKIVELKSAFNLDKVVQELVTARNYSKIIDFDEHFADITLDWRNLNFNA